MDVNFNYVHVTASERLEALTNKNLEKLKKRYDWIVRAEVFFKKENTTDPEKGMVCEFKVSAPGQNLFSSSNHKNFDAAISEATEDMRKQLQKKKEKMSVH